MMIPITRKEKYINEIVGGGNTAPETPYTRKELFFAGILGEVVAPSPITRAEKYLAKIANKYSGELPEPVTRIERFLALVAGMNISIPTPVTREEMFWADYALIVEKELSGIPPLTFVSNGDNLADYRIYGASGGVGDRTANLFDEKYPSITTSWDVIYQHIRVGDGNYTLSTTTPQNPTSGSANLFLFGGIATGGADSQKNGVYYGTSRTVESKNGYITIGYRAPQGNDPRNFHTMLCKGSTAATYEPYGYKIPIVCGGTTTNIYLDEPLAKPGNNADYIDYAAQKRHNSDGTESSVTLPEISTLAGTNTLTVGTEVQPSDVYIKYEGAR